MPPRLVVGMMGSSVSKGAERMASPEQVNNFLATLKKHGIDELDTARAYVGGRSEELLGEVRASDRFTIATKAPAFSPGSLEPQKIYDNCDRSLQALKVQKIPLYFFHGPDSATPLQEQARAAGKLHQDGKIERFGLSNIGAAEVETIYNTCRDESLVKPTVYQGMYNPVARNAATQLFPTLRKLNMSFYAYSPLGGGLFAKDLDRILSPEAGTRFAEMPFLKNFLLKDEQVSAVRNLALACKAANITVMSATLRWLLHHSDLTDNDAIILGASSTEQIEASLTACKGGSLESALVDAFENVWTTCKDTAPAASM